MSGMASKQSRTLQRYNRAPAEPGEHVLQDKNPPSVYSRNIGETNAKRLSEPAPLLAHESEGSEPTLRMP